MKAPIPLLVLLNAVMVPCLKVVSKRGSGECFNQTKTYLFIFAFCDIESFKVSSSEIGWPIRDEKQSCPAS